MHNLRLQYEQWQININGFDPTDFKRSSKLPDEYQYQAIQRDWIVWQAATEQASQPQADRADLKELAARLRQITAVNMPLTIEQRELINAIDERLSAV